MDLEESFDLPVARERAWAAFRDLSVLVSCLPGAKLTSDPQADPVQIVFAVKLGPINVNFTGIGAVDYGGEYACRFSGGGADRNTNSRVKGAAKFSLHETANGTHVRLAVDYALTGALAQFGRPGIVKEIAANLTRQFADNLRTTLSQAADGATRTAPAQLDAADLMMQVARGRIQRMFGGKNE
jgi:carbon monoxide dehydrogenase subunit G